MQWILLILLLLQFYNLLQKMAIVKIATLFMLTTAYSHVFQPELVV